MTDTHDEYLELHRQHTVGYTRAEVIAVLEGNVDEPPPNERETAVPLTDEAAMKGNFHMKRRLVIVVDASRVPMNDDPPEVLAYNLLSAYGEYSAPPHTAHWEDDAGYIAAHELPL